jgi:hypothetical protein
MKERPILMSAPMVRALLDGTKTQTRRVVKGEALQWLVRDKFAPAFVADPANYLCPYGQPGDRLWVRETFSGPWCMEAQDGIAAAPPSKWGEFSRIWYWADGEPTQGDWTRPRPSIHMPRWASRITLEVTGVRVERLNDITRGEAMAEGCPFPNMKFGPDPREWFADLWSSINGEGNWDLNPWVWVVEFRRVAP